MAVKKKSHIMHWKLTGLFFVLPSLTGVCVFLLVPFLDVVRRSFLGAVSEEWVGFKNYITVFQNGAFRLAAGNTLRFVAVCIPLLILLSLFFSVFLQGKVKGSHMIKMAFLVPMAIPVASVVLLWRVLFHGQGLINGLLAGHSLFAEHGLLTGLGFGTTDWMNTDYAFGVLVFSYLWKNIGYNIILWSAGLAAIPESIYEAARMDGAGNVRIFFRITLPNLWPVLNTIAVLSLLNSFKVFREAYLVAGDYPHESMYLVQHLFNNWFRELSLDKISAAAILVSIVITFLVIQLERRLGEGQ